MPGTRLQSQAAFPPLKATTFNRLKAKVSIASILNVANTHMSIDARFLPPKGFGNSVI